MKKITLIALAVILLTGTILVSCGPGAEGNELPGDEKWAFVADTSWYSDGPVAFDINTPEELAGLAKLVNNGNNFQGKTLTQIAVLDLAGKLWTPIGTESNSFKGTFIGKNITGLTITGSVNYQGLFGIIVDGEVEGVKLTDISISGGVYVGGVVGYNGAGAMVKNCSVTGSVTGIGGIGGVVGINFGEVTGCSAKDVSVEGGGGVGGVVGTNQGKVSASYSTGSVKGKDNIVGGIVGNNHSAVFTLSGCYSTCAVTGSASLVGGIVGSINSGNVTNCVALNTSISGASPGRVAGSPGTLANNYGRSDMPGTWNLNDTDMVDGADVDADDYNDQAWWKTAFPNGPGFDFGISGAWAWGDNDLPKLKWE